MRTALIKRKTAETDIELKLTIGGKGADIDTGCGFLDHMLCLFARHGGFALSVKCKGDTQVDYHHTVEDVAICLGSALKQALGDNRGITRYGSASIPMDEALVMTAVDISGRAHLEYGLMIPAHRVGDFDTELTREFMEAFVRQAGLTLHIVQFAGENSHHIIEGCFKSLARSLRQAVRLDPENADSVPSTKGVI